MIHIWQILDYIVANMDEDVEFNDYGYAKMHFSLLNANGDVILDDIEQIYKNYYKLSKDKSIAQSTRYSKFLEDVTSIKYDFVGDKYYTNY